MPGVMINICWTMSCVTPRLPVMKPERLEDRPSMMGKTASAMPFDFQILEGLMEFAAVIEYCPLPRLVASSPTGATLSTQQSLSIGAAKGAP
jgi:hypothetical protein